MEYLYFFGYEDLIDREVNERLDRDDQSSILIRIEAESSEKAENWGDEIAEHFVKHLYKDPDFSWKAAGYGSGLELNLEQYKDDWNKIPKAIYGEFPDFDTLEDPWD